MPGHIFDRIIAAHLHTTTHRPLNETAAAAYLDRYAGPEGQQRYLDQVAHFTEDDTCDVVARLGEVTAPTRVIWGEHDEWLEPAAGMRLSELVPGAELVTIPMRDISSPRTTQRRPRRPCGTSSPAAESGLPVRRRGPGRASAPLLPWIDSGADAVQPPPVLR